jgi:hypothetical protein
VKKKISTENALTQMGTIGSILAQLQMAQPFTVVLIAT